MRSKVFVQDSLTPSPLFVSCTEFYQLCNIHIIIFTTRGWVRPDTFGSKSSLSCTPWPPPSPYLVRIREFTGTFDLIPKIVFTIIVYSCRFTLIQTHQFPISMPGDIFVLSWPPEITPWTSHAVTTRRQQYLYNAESHLTLSRWRQ